jgi:alpha-glucuronidase
MELRRQLTSWRTYENYTGPLGLQTLTDITGNHFDVNVDFGHLPVAAKQRKDSYARFWPGTS